MLRPRLLIALENADSFQYRMYKRYNKTKSGPGGGGGGGEWESLNFLIQGAQMALEFLAYFDPCSENVKRDVTF